MSDTDIQTFTGTAQLAEYQETLAGPDWLKEIRTRARDRFYGVHWPTTNEEEWRRTSLRAFQFDAYTAGSPSVALSYGASDSGPDGVEFARLSELVARGKADAEAAARAALERALDEADNRLELWNLSLLEDPVVLVVPRGTTVEEPFIADFSLEGDEVVFSTCVIAHLGDGASATLVKRTTSGEDGEVLALETERAVIGQNAGLTITSLQFLNEESLVFNNSTGRLERDARILRTEANLGADFVKARFACTLAGPGADAALNGIVFATDEQHMDVRTVQNHEAPRSSSRAFYRGAVSGESHSIYQGMITVSPEAKGTDAYLTSKNLILSEEARADSIPSLNISTDDVKCSHGSTTGKLDENQVFYLQTRGYSEEESRRTLVEGYFEEAIASVPQIVQEDLRRRIANRVVQD